MENEEDCSSSELSELPFHNIKSYSHSIDIQHFRFSNAPVCIQSKKGKTEGRAYMQEKIEQQKHAPPSGTLETPSGHTQENVPQEQLSPDRNKQDQMRRFNQIFATVDEQNARLEQSSRGNKQKLCVDQQNLKQYVPSHVSVQMQEKNKLPSQQIWSQQLVQINQQSDNLTEQQQLPIYLEQPQPKTSRQEELQVPQHQQEPLQQENQEEYEQLMHGTEMHAEKSKIQAQQQVNVGFVEEDLEQVQCRQQKQNHYPNDIISLTQNNEQQTVLMKVSKQKIGGQQRPSFIDLEVINIEIGHQKKVPKEIRVIKNKSKKHNEEKEKKKGIQVIDLCLEESDPNPVIATAIANQVQNEQVERYPNYSDIEFIFGVRLRKWKSLMTLNAIMANKLGLQQEPSKLQNNDQKWKYRINTDFVYELLEVMDIKYNNFSSKFKHPTYRYRVARKAPAQEDEIAKQWRLSGKRESIYNLLNSIFQTTWSGNAYEFLDLCNEKQLDLIQEDIEVSVTNNVKQLKGYPISKGSSKFIPTKDEIVNQLLYFCQIGQLDYSKIKEIPKPSLVSYLFNIVTNDMQEQMQKSRQENPFMAPPTSQSQMPKIMKNTIILDGNRVMTTKEIQKIIQRQKQKQFSAAVASKTNAEQSQDNFIIQIQRQTPIIIDRQHKESRGQASKKSNQQKEKSKKNKINMIRSSILQLCQQKMADNKNIKERKSQCPQMADGPISSTVDPCQQLISNCITSPWHQQFQIDLIQRKVNAQNKQPHLIDQKLADHWKVHEENLNESEMGASRKRVHYDTSQKQQWSVSLIKNLFNLQAMIL